MIKNLTQGSPGKVLWSFSMPMLLSVMFQQLYNVVDSVVAGKFVGEDALAAVGASYPVTMIFMAVATGANVGASVVISRLFGAGENRNMKTAINTSIVSVAVLSAILTVFGLIFCWPILEAMDTPANIFDDASVYLEIYIGGLIFLFIYNICTGIFTALGDSKTPLYFLIFSSLGNIVLDVVSVTALDMGVAGVAWATFLAQGVSSILAFVTLFRRLSALSKEKGKLFSLDMLGRISVMAVPSILQQSFVSVGNIFIQTLVNGYGSAAVAGYSAAVKLNTFAITSFTTLSSSMSNFTSQNIGAGELKRVRQGFRTGMIMIMCVALPFVIAFVFFGEPMIRLFVDSPTQTAIDTGTTFLVIVAPFYFMAAAKQIADGILRGAGAVLGFVTSTFSDLLLRVVLAIVFSKPLGMGSTGIWLAWPVGWMISGVYSLICYFSGMWVSHAKKQMADAASD